MPPVEGAVPPGPVRFGEIFWWRDSPSHRVPPEEEVPVMIIFRWFFWVILRLGLAARYRITVRGREQLRNLKGPILILPNHPGYIDPFLLFATLWPSLRMRPLVYSGTFKGLTGRFLVKL